MARYKAVIAGASGAASARLVDLLAADRDWEVVGLCRRPPERRDGVAFIAVDLADAADCRKKFGRLAEVTHVFYAARAEHAEGEPEDVAANLALLRNVVEGVGAVAGGLRHVHLVHGTNYYGPGLGPYRTPAREDDPRRQVPNFYYDQQDYIVGRQRGKAWTWSISRPDVICDFAPGRARNIIPVIAVYAAVCKESGLPLSFPGTPGNFGALVEITEAALLARAIAWMATTEACANQAFNVTNGGYYRWRNLWPRLAEFFGMADGPVRHVRLEDFMADKAAVWERVVERHGLRPTPYEETALWRYGDTHFTRVYDTISDTTKLRLHGFPEVVDTEEMFLRLLGRYRDARITP